MTAKKKSISQNALFNVVYKAFMYVFPLLISSYVGRVLQSDGVGHVSFVQNIVSYFTSLVALGIPTYGTREIAKCQTDEERNRVFSSLFVINSVSTIIFSLVYYVMIFTVPYFYSNLLLYAIGGIQIIFNFINIDWLYQGIEEYKYIAIRSLVVRTVSLVCIFLFVNSKSDVWIYLLINCVANVGNYILNAFRARTIVKLSFNNLSCEKHLKSVFILLATVIAVELYTKIDTTFIGVMLTESDVGYYVYADRIVKIPITVVAAINSVALPRLSTLYKTGDKNSFHDLLKKFHETNLMLVIPGAVGMFLLSTEYVTVLFGADFIPSGSLLQILSPLIVIMSLGNLFGTQAIIAIGKEGKKFIATLISALLNIVGTPLLIKTMGASGACLASLASELIVLGINISILAKYDKPVVNIAKMFHIVIATVSMAIAILGIKYITSSCWLVTILGTSVGVIVYVAILILIDKDFRRVAQSLFLKILRKRYCGCQTNRY